MAALYHYNILAPGRWGINLQEQNLILHPNWATKTDGLVLSKSNLLRARGSISITTTAPASAELLRIHNYIGSTGTETVISSTATKILKTVGDLSSAGNNISPTGAPTNGFWKFINFNGKVLAWQAGHTPISWNGSGVFATITVSDGGTLPDGDCAHAAFGRVWAVDDDKQTVRYSGLLDETQWATASGAGSIDMRNVWSQGIDYVTGISSLGSNLFIFGRKHIVVYTDGLGSQLGVSPSQMYVVDIIEGTGCVSRDSITQIGEGDLIYLSEVGVQSLRRVIASKDNPVNTISWQIADRIASAVKTEVAAQSSSSTDVRGFTGIYIPTTGQYLLIHNNGSVEDVYAFHLDARAQDDQGREVVPITIWDASVLANFRAAIQQRTGTIYFIGGLSAHINTYNPDGTLDDSLSGIALDYESGWMAWLDPQIEPLAKLLKFVQVGMTNSGGLESQTNLQFATDFNTTFSEVLGASTDESPVRNIYDTMGDTEGQYYKLGLEDARFGGKQIEQISMHMKIGRPAFVHSREGQGDTAAASTPNANLQLLIAINSDATGDSSKQRAATSMDGITWTARSFASVATWKDVHYSQELHLAVAVAANTINTSPDGITWTARTSPGNGGWNSVAWSPDLDLFVAVGQSLTLQRVMTSPDGITWTLRATPSNCDKTWVKVIWSDYLKAFVAGSNATTNGIMTSPDGINWTLRVTSTDSSEELVSDDDNGVLISGPRSTLTYGYSLTGADWASVNASFTNGATALGLSPELGIMVRSDTGANYSAPLGTLPYAWTSRSIGGITGYEDITWAPVLDRFFAIKNQTAVYSSTNGTTWASYGTLPSASTWLRVIETEEV